MKKKILSAGIIVALATVAIAGGTLAYFTDEDKADNVFTVGNVSIDLTEPNWDASGSQDAPEVYPGEALAKDPTVTNDGANPCFVRVKVTGFDCLAPAGLVTYRTDYVADKLGDNWVDGGDGYFYNTKVLAAGATTDALFDQIVIPTNLKNGDGEKLYTINVQAEAVQAQGAKPSFSAVEAMTLDEIKAWFGTCMA